MLLDVQVQSLLPSPDFRMVAYNPAMSQKFGSHLMELRRTAGLSQNALAAKLGVPQSNISFWEKWDKPPRGDILPSLAQALSVSVDELLGYKAPKRKAAPVGKARHAFDAVSRLPRRQQDQIIKVVNALVAQHATAKAA
jgi:transcriptional regulator with XRE-family HTH domain